MGKIVYKTVDEYINAQPEKTKIALIEMRSIIREALPGAAEIINYNMPAFVLAAGGKMSKQIMMAGYKNHIGFYPHAETIGHFAKKLSSYVSGKGSVQFPLTEPLPKKLITEMIMYRKKQLGL